MAVHRYKRLEPRRQHHPQALGLWLSPGLAILLFWLLGVLASMAFLGFIMDPQLIPPVGA